jgi:hypothetical protein
MPLMGRPDMPGPPAAPAASAAPPEPLVIIPVELPAVSKAEPATEPSLLMERGPVPITLPTAAIPLNLPPRFVLEFLDNLPGGFPAQMRVLPGRELAFLEALAAQDPPGEFRVTGQTTSYRGKAYILLLTIAKDSPPRAQRSEQPSGPAPALPAPEALRATSRPVPADDAERIRTSLMKNRPARPLVPPPVPPTPRNLEAGGASSLRPPAAPPAGDILIDRTVRIASSPDGQWMEARFEADNTLQEQPVPLLPCRLLERAEVIGGKVRITGILRRYKGQDYLLLRKVLTERNMGQF